MSGEDAAWSDMRLGELVRVLEEQKEAGETKRQRFRAKLEMLKERQHELQQRRIDRLKDEGIVIDLVSIRRKVRQSRRAKLREKKSENDGSESGEEANPSGDEWDDYENEIDSGHQSARGGSRDLVHMDSTASLHRQSRLGKIHEEIEGTSTARRTLQNTVHQAFQRTETKLSVVKSFQIPGRNGPFGEMSEDPRRRTNPKLAHAATLLKAVNAFRSPGRLSPRTWRGSAKNRFPAMGVDNRPGSGAGSPQKQAPMSKESKARHLFSYSGFNKK